MNNAQTVLAAAALLIMGVLAGLMMFFPIPQANGTPMTFILGAIAGAITVGGGSKLADKFTQSTGPGAVVQPDAPSTAKE